MSAFCDRLAIWIVVSQDEIRYIEFKTECPAKTMPAKTYAV